MSAYFLWTSSQFRTFVRFYSAYFSSFCLKFFICPRLVVGGAPPMFLGFFFWLICFYGGIYMPSSTPSHSLTCNPLPFWFGPLLFHASAGVPPFKFWWGRTWLYQFLKICRLDAISSAGMITCWCVFLTCQRIFQFFRFAKGRPLLWFGVEYLRTINRTGTVWR